MFFDQTIKIFHLTVKPSKTHRELCFSHATLVTKRDKSLNKLMKGFDVLTEQVILQQFNFFALITLEKKWLSSHRQLSRHGCVYFRKVIEFISYRNKKEFLDILWFFSLGFYANLSEAEEKNLDIVTKKLSRIDPRRKKQKKIVSFKINSSIFQNSWMIFFYF